MFAENRVLNLLITFTSLDKTVSEGSRLIHSSDEIVRAPNVFRVTADNRKQSLSIVLFSPMTTALTCPNSETWRDLVELQSRQMPQEDS